MKLVFMGTPAAAARSLGVLIEAGHEIVAVYTPPDRAVGRGGSIQFSPVKTLALANGLEVRQPEKIRTTEAASAFLKLEADAAAVVAYGRILPEPYLTAFRYGAINVHFSLLPKYRGAAPVNWAVANGETETGVTTMKMDNGLDTGSILLQHALLIRTGETAAELTARLANVGADLLVETLRSIDSIIPRAQDDSAATYAPILSKADGLIDWTMSAKSIVGRINGFQPFPTAYTFFRSKRLTVWAGEAAKQEKLADAGTIVDVSAGQIEVACGLQTSLNLLELQMEGKRRMSARDFLNGIRVNAGERLLGRVANVE